MKRYRRQAADQDTPDHMTLLSLWLKLRESSFELVKFKSSSMLKNEAWNIRNLFDIPSNQ